MDLLHGPIPPGDPVEGFNEVPIEPVPQSLRRVSHDDGVRLNILGNHGAGTDHSTVPDGDPRKNQGIAADPNVVAHNDVALDFPVGHLAVCKREKGVERVGGHHVHPMLTAQQKNHAIRDGTKLPDLELDPLPVTDHRGEPVGPIAYLVLRVGWIPVGDRDEIADPIHALLSLSRWRLPPANRNRISLCMNDGGADRPLHRTERQTELSSPRAGPGPGTSTRSLGGRVPFDPVVPLPETRRRVVPDTGQVAGGPRWLSIPAAPWPDHLPGFNVSETLVPHHLTILGFAFKNLNLGPTLVAGSLSLDAH